MYLPPPYLNKQDSLHVICYCYREAEPIAYDFSSPDYSSFPLLEQALARS